MCGVLSAVYSSVHVLCYFELIKYHYADFWLYVYFSLLCDNSYMFVAGLFLGIWNWGGMDKCLRGEGVNMREAQIDF